MATVPAVAHAPAAARPRSPDEVDADLVAAFRTRHEIPSMLPGEVVTNLLESATYVRKLFASTSTARHRSRTSSGE